MNIHVPPNAMPTPVIESAAMPYAPTGTTAATPIEAAKQKQEKFLMGLPGVSGISVGLMASGEQAIVVYVKDAASKKGIPAQIGGHKVDARVIGQIDAQK